LIGAGIIGMATAVELTRRGHAVTVLEAAAEVGQGASYANGGQLSYSHAEPWANTGVLPLVARALVSRKGPMAFHPTRRPEQWLWAMRFLAACLNPLATRKGMEAIYWLNDLSRRHLAQWQAEHP